MELGLGDKTPTQPCGMKENRAADFIRSVGSAFPPSRLIVIHEYKVCRVVRMKSLDILIAAKIITQFPLGEPVLSRPPIQRVTCKRRNA